MNVSDRDERIKANAKKNEINVTVWNEVRCQ